MFTFDPADLEPETKKPDAKGHLAIPDATLLKNLKGTITAPVTLGHKLSNFMRPVVSPAMK